MQRLGKVARFGVGPFPITSAFEDVALEVVDPGRTPARIVDTRRSSITHPHRSRSDVTLELGHEPRQRGATR